MPEAQHKAFQIGINIFTGGRNSWTWMEIILVKCTTIIKKLCHKTLNHQPPLVLTKIIGPHGKLNQFFFFLEKNIKELLTCFSIKIIIINSKYDSCWTSTFLNIDIVTYWMTFAFKYWNDDMSDGSGLLDCDNKKNQNKLWMSIIN
jgi:hypothetical protein